MDRRVVPRTNVTQWWHAHLRSIIAHMRAIIERSEGFLRVLACVRGSA
jgi:hypothetical protein